MKRLTKRWQDTPCVLWQGRINVDGYGMKGKRLAHRVVWEERRWPIPRGKELDHLCKVRACVNVLHLQVVTKQQNMERSDMWVWRTKIEQCPQGHDYDEANTGYTLQRASATRKQDTVVRYCKACKRDRSRVERAVSKPARCEERGHQRVEKVGVDGKRYCVVCAADRGRKAAADRRGTDGRFVPQVRR